MSRPRIVVVLAMLVSASCALLDPFPDLAEPRVDAGRLDGATQEDGGGSDGARDAPPTPVCTPMATRACGFEQCQGVERCTEEGVWQPCSVPDASVERCETPADESCDGVGACTGDLRWANPLPTSGESHAWSIALATSGDVYAAGWFLGAMTLPDGSTLAQGGSPTLADGFLVKMTRGGKLVWARRLADAPIASVTAGKNDVLVTGALLATSVAGECGSLVRTSTSAFAVRYAFDGSCRNKKVLEGAATAISTIDPSIDDAIVAGELVAPLALGGAPDSGADTLAPPGEPGETSGYIVRLDPTFAGKSGAAFASKNLAVHGIAAERAGKVSISGTADGAIFLILPKGPGMGWVATFDEKAVRTWEYRVGTSYGNDPTSLAYGEDGTLYIAGAFIGWIDLAPTGPLLSATPGSVDGYVIARSPAPYVFSGRAFGREGLERPRAMAVDPSGAVLLAGYVANGDVTLGGESFTTPSASTVLFVSKHRPTTFDTEWTRYITSDGDSHGNAIVTSPFGDVFVAGDFSPVIDFGGGIVDAGPGSFVMMRRP